MRAVLRFATLLTATACASTQPPPLAASSARAGTVLADIAIDRHVEIIALIRHGEWQSGTQAGREALAAFVHDGAKLELLPRLPDQLEPRGTIALKGTMRERCYDYFGELATDPPGFGLAVISGGAQLPVVPVRSVQPDATHAAAVARVLRDVAGIELAPKVDRAYTADLDRDGSLETIIEATHPDLAGDPPEYLPEHYSLLVVVSANSTATPAYTGYIHKTQGSVGFQVVTLETVADVDFDTQPELLVRARHAEGWQTQVYRYRGALERVFWSLGGEGECPETSE